ncbi:MAG: DUF1697 domain-containing protein [Actinomycetota bacterium]
MERWFAFVRAINTGARRLRNDELIAAFDSFGLDEPAAFQAAGNVTFRSAEAPDETALAAHLGDELGFECPVFIRAAEDLGAIAASCPFGDDDLAGTEGRVQLTLLAAAPSSAAVDAVRKMVPTDDLVVIAGSEWWWLPRAGISTSTLRVRAIEDHLGPMTTRTLATVERLLAKFDA